VNGQYAGTVRNPTDVFPGCGATDPSVLHLEKAAGSYSYSVTDSKGFQWSGVARVTGGECTTVPLSNETRLNTKGTISFWTSSEKFSAIDIWVQGAKIGTLHQYYTSVPDCDGSATIHTDVEPGTYDWFARDSYLGTQISGTITVDRGACKQVEVKIPDPIGNDMGAVVFWTPYQIPIARIEITLDGNYVGYLDLDNNNGSEPSCNDDTGVKITKLPGNYYYKATSFDSGGKPVYWEGMVDIHRGECTKLKLTWR
jgi:hypothetical protein